MTAATTTTDHDTIRKWAEERQGRPARVAATGDAGGILRIDFRDPEEGLEEVGWEDFFTIFEDNDLAFLYQDRTEDGSVSRFHKFVDRNGA